VKKDNITIVIGAGPYGIGLAAHLKARGIPTLILGKPMELWKKMPTELCLKSIWTASSLADPGGNYSIDRYIAEKHLSHLEPIPLPFFLDYAQWFLDNTRPDIDPTYVQTLAPDGKGYHVELTDGRSVKAKNVIVAAGISAFMNVPDFARDLPASLAGHTGLHKDLSRFKDKRVVVVGNGQSALEYAALLNEEGAHVELIARGVVRWHTKILYDYTGPARHIFYPPGDVGPPGINWLVAFPRIYNYLPDSIKYPIHRRAILPGGAKWLRPRIEGNIRVTEQTQIVKATSERETLCLKLNDGTTREVDYLFLGTGYKHDIHKLTFIDPVLSQRVQEKDGFPILNKWYESSSPHLYFVGALAGRTFGPTCRFISGSKAVAQQITRHPALTA
jgi:FAD-dependent urate hydroxylase